jgi:ABC-type Fe3+/spermidine/putrescine transport system ATPase subunit
MVYIGTDTRYVVSVASGDPVVVRVQNGCDSEAAVFKRGDRVAMHWSPEDARLLAE